MTIDIVEGWGLDVETELDWLCVTVRCQDGHTWETPPLAELIWEIVAQFSTHQLVVELHEVAVLHSLLIGQMVLLHKRITSKGGIMRFAGLSRHNQEALDVAKLGDRFPWYKNRDDAVRNVAAKQPM